MECKCYAFEYPDMVYIAASAEEAARQYGIDCGIPPGVVIIVSPSDEIGKRYFLFSILVEPVEVEYSCCFEGESPDETLWIEAVSVAEAVRIYAGGEGKSRAVLVTDPSDGTTVRVEAYNAS